ncbi:hypothetical protein TrLO_g14499 [Triparma laevis f. longispina]|uniref:peptidylprolyl isomerase n=1 Tax=Triparma laevis f. longispina TaxID=1714387 RepID=A0A9W7E7R0_9STRA|nr:hypothetical protein TrLO_g14499 [Triparma laevis f. longispina]
MLPLFRYSIPIILFLAYVSTAFNIKTVFNPKITKSHTSSTTSFLPDVASPILSIFAAPILALTLFTSSATLDSQPAYANPAPLADVGLREFLVKDSNQLLRLSLPSSMTPSSPIDLPNDPGRRAQESVELVRLRLEQVGFAGKPSVWAACLKEVNNANSIVTSDEFLKSVPSSSKKKAQQMREQVDGTLEQLRDSIRKEDPKQTLAYQESAAAQIYEIRLLSMKSGLPYTLPPDVSKLPILKGRATVQFDISHSDTKNTFLLDDGMKSTTLPLTLTIDGYRAPVTSGNFVDLVKSGGYDNQKITSTDDLFVNTASKTSPRKIPLELFYKKDTSPTYHYSSDDDLRATESFADPFQSVGALGMVHEPEDNDSANSEFFFLKWDQGLVAPGRNTLDGSSACFGYVVENQGALEQIKSNDVITKATVISGIENLK